MERVAKAQFHGIRAAPRSSSSCTTRGRGGASASSSAANPPAANVLLAREEAKMARMEAKMFEDVDVPALPVDPQVALQLLGMAMADVDKVTDGVCDGVRVGGSVWKVGESVGKVVDGAEVVGDIVHGAESQHPAQAR